MVREHRSYKIITIICISIITSLIFIFLYTSLTSLSQVNSKLQTTTKQPIFIVTQLKDAQFNVKQMSIYSKELVLNRTPSFVNSINIQLKRLYLDTENIYEMLKGVYQGPPSDLQQLKLLLEKIKTNQDKLIIMASCSTTTNEQLTNCITVTLQNVYTEFDNSTNTILFYEQQLLSNLSSESKHIFNMNAFVIITLALAVIVFVIAFNVFQRRTNRRLEQASSSLNEALQKANRAANAKSEFLARMSHDIRTPLNGIIGMNYIAQQSLNNKEILSDALLKMQTSAEYLLKLLNDILDMTKIESGKMTLSESQFNMNEIISSVVQMEQSAAYQKRQTFTVLVPETFGFIFVGDRLRISQILMNLLSNAIKFTPDCGTITLQASSTQISDNTVAITFVIADTGIGISEDMQQRLFKPFEQENAQITSQYGGSGLGLSIVSLLITMMKGSISVQSKKDEGSTFKVTIPLKIEKSPVIDSHEDITNASANPLLFKGYRALVLEDNKINLQILIEILGMFGMKSDSANDGKEGLDKFMSSEQGTYDVVFSDIRMPTMDGYQFARAVRASAHPQAKSIPIIAMSANAFDEDIQASHESGMNDHLCKPIDVKSLVTTLSKYIRQIN